MEPSAFDRHAADYAAAWEDDPVAVVQRRRVHEALAAGVSPGQSLLDLGCGTGLDAELLARRGVRVHGVDASEAMLDRARARCVGLPAQFSRVDLGRGELPDGRFDAALSNFGALNCVALAPVAAAAAERLAPGAPFVVVLIPRVSPVEMLAFLARGQLRAALRRFGATARVAGEDIPFHAPSSAAVVEAFRPWFTLERQAALGVVLPVPGPLGRPFTRFTDWLDPLDRRLGSLPGLRRVGDHVVYVFRRRTRRFEASPLQLHPPDSSDEQTPMIARRGLSDAPR